MQEGAVVIYADELIFINICFDALCLYITSLICRERLKPCLLILASLAGGIYALLHLFIQNVIISVLSAALSEMLICLIAFRHRELKRYFAICAFFAVTSALLGGMLSAFCFLIGIEQTSINIFLLLPAALVSAFCTLCYLTHFRSRGKADCKRAVICIGDVVIDEIMLVDSGNTAIEPSSGLPMIFISRSLFDRSLAAACKDRLLPVTVTTAVSTETLYFFLPDSAAIYIKGKPCKTFAAVAIGNANDYCGTKGLLPASLL